MSLVSTGASVVRAVFAKRPPDAGSRSGRSYAITLMTPVRAGQEAALAAQIDGLGIGAESPLAQLPYVHFARFLLVDQLKTEWPGAPSPPPRLRSAYLLFTASITAPDDDYSERMPSSFLEQLRTVVSADADAIWGHCVAYPGTPDRERFVRYLASSQLETSLFHVGYPDVTVDQVRQRLAVRDSLIAFALDVQGKSDAELHQAYLKESPTWFP